MTIRNTTVVRHTSPNPADVGPKLGWSGAIVEVIAGQVTGSIIRSIDTDRAVVDEAQIHIDTEQHDGYMADVVTDDPAVLRALSAVAATLADELGGAE
ncbi:hypothetical protein [Mycobacterium sp. EPa45]|uniref:hypothetical protein n=1 Tax=Mycobacterium sp. EPa45 TaxID=1545728 RepID=UPI000641ADA4|nr:hypothetical protein [Mycobacterium sp. EPa45]AKK28202.1 hypothetical protein AB431_17620 [Mycobacterium sp. EPa45]